MNDAGQSAAAGRRAGSRNGFTLVEVLVALAIAALAGGFLLQIFSQGLRNVDTAGRYLRATAVAESVLATVGSEVPLEPGDSTGSVDGSYRWNVKIEPFDETRDGDLPVRLYDVEITVAWGEQARERTVSLRTLRVAKVTRR